MTSPARGTAPDGAAEALAAALSAAGLPAVPGARLLRHGSTAVFALGPAGTRAPVVARVSPGTPDAAADLGRALAVARWLAGTDLPAVRAVDDATLAVPQPVAVPGHLVTFWHSLGDDPQPGTTADLGALLRRFHTLRPPAGLVTAPMDPVGRITRQLAGARHLADADRAFLARRLDDVAARHAALPPALPPGHLHGDATVANVVRAADGTATLVDLDLVRAGPREWDLLRTAVYTRRLRRHTEAEYRAFVAAYGVDVAALPGFDVRADLTELLQVAWLADAANARPGLAAELAARIATLRTGGDRGTWRLL